MRILISNDDGFHAKGIQTLAKVLREVGHTVVIIAPDRNRSAASSCLTLVDPLRVHRFDEYNYAVIAGTPADCVHLALNGLFGGKFAEKFDLVVSGINHGANLGDDVVYSGTVAAALEGRHLPLPSIAVSLVGRKHSSFLDGENHFETAAQVVLDLLEKIEKQIFPSNHVLNVNVPNLPYSELKGTMITRLGERSTAAEIVKQKDPRNADVYWIGVTGEPIDESYGTDFYALNRDCVSITPIQADMTSHKAITILKGIFNETV